MRLVSIVHRRRELAGAGSFKSEVALHSVARRGAVDRHIHLPVELALVTHDEAIVSIRRVAGADIERGARVDLAHDIDVNAISPAAPRNVKLQVRLPAEPAEHDKSEAVGARAERRLDLHVRVVDGAEA